MEKIYRTSDRIRVKIGGLVVTISPLGFDQKSEIQALALSTSLVDGLDSAKKAVKYSVKDVEGLEDSNGAYKIEFDESGVSEESLDILFNTAVSDNLAFTCLNLLKSIPKEFINPHTGKKLKGVSIVKTTSGKKK